MNVVLAVAGAWTTLTFTEIMKQSALGFRPAWPEATSQPSGLRRSVSEHTFYTLGHAITCSGGASGDASLG